MKLKKIIKRYAKTNVAGFVFGFLKKNMIDEKTIKQLLKVTNHKETIFHMAFDELDNPKQGIDTLVRLGITRILTKGGKQGPATNNLVQLKALATYADQRIQLIVGGSVTDHNYQEIAKATGIKCYHGRKLALGT
jgi:copper homeostasis protein